MNSKCEIECHIFRTVNIRMFQKYQYIEFPLNLIISNSVGDDSFHTNMEINDENSTIIKPN